MKTSQATRQAILQLHNEGYSDSEIGRRLGIHRSTVARWIRRQAELGNTDNRHRRGRPRCTTPEDDQAIAAVIAAAHFTPASNIRDTLGLQCTPQTVRNRHHSEGLRGRIPATKPVLSEANMESRVEYALEYADKPHQFWENVIFCDEKTFCSDGPPANKHVWRHPNTRVRRMLGNFFVDDAMATRNVKRVEKWIKFLSNPDNSQSLSDTCTKIFNQSKGKVLRMGHNEKVRRCKFYAAEIKLRGVFERGA
ncbi:uncharacterized protein [Panulirus ornatus]|uniref:uncharacterized protein n=1 Tax=Panulirus ornatus TaxID=150431 RepID=UPI003A852B16